MLILSALKMPISFDGGRTRVWNTGTGALSVHTSLKALRQQHRDYSYDQRIGRRCLNAPLPPHPTVTARVHRPSVRATLNPRM